MYYASLSNCGWLIILKQEHIYENKRKIYSSKKPVGLGLSKTKWKVVAQGKHNKEGIRYILTLRDLVEWIETNGDSIPQISWPHAR